MNTNPVLIYTYFIRMRATEELQTEKYVGVILKGEK